MTDFNTLIFAALIGYALGSIPFGYIFTRLAGRGDIRDIGSGNIGTTNVLRTGSKFLTLLTLLADIGKGAIAVSGAWYLADELGTYVMVGDIAAYVAAIAALIGHMFPIWLGFRGGKGSAVFLGTMLMLSPLTGIVAIVVWLLTALIFRISSLASLVTVIASLALLLVLGEQNTALTAVIMAVLIFWAHRSNMSRLRAGQEPHIGNQN